MFRQKVKISSLFTDELFTAKVFTFLILFNLLRDRLRKKQNIKSKSSTPCSTLSSIFKKVYLNISHNLIILTDVNTLRITVGTAGKNNSHCSENFKLVRIYNSHWCEPALKAHNHLFWPNSRIRMTIFMYVGLNTVNYFIHVCPLKLFTVET